MHGIPGSIVLAVTLVGLSACSSAAPATTTPLAPASATSATPSLPPSASTAPPASSPGSTAQALADPCQVLTRPEASALSGMKMPAGVKQPWGKGVKCGYTSGSVESFLILEQAKTSAKAQAAWDAEKAQLQQQAKPVGVKVTATSVPGIGDRAELFVGSVTLGGVKNTVMAIFVLKGATFVDLGDIALRGAAPATTAAIEAQASTSVGRV